MNVNEALKVVKSLSSSYRELEDAAEVLAKEVKEIQRAEVIEGALLIAHERNRSKQRWNEDHDDGHKKGELLRAAVCYTNEAFSQMRGYPLTAFPKSVWPWHSDYWRPASDPVVNLAKAGALIAAEIDRLNRKNCNE